MQTLSQTLAATRASVVAKLPHDVMAKIERQIAELRASGILDRAIKVGDTMPSFALENQNGEIVASEPLLGRGPLVINFYRGKW